MQVLESRTQNHIGVNSLAFDGVIVSHHRRFNHPWVPVEGVLNFGRAQTMPRNIDHIVHPAYDAKHSIGIPSRSVTSKVIARKGRKIRGTATLVIAPGGPQNRGPRESHREQPFLLGRGIGGFQFTTLGIQQHRLHPWQRTTRVGGFERG